MTNPRARPTSSRLGANRQGSQALTKINRSKPPELDAGALFQRIERAFDVHDEAAAVLEEPRDQRPAFDSIGVVRDREHDRVCGLEVSLQVDSVLAHAGRPG